MLFADLLTLDKPRRTTDGYLVTRAKAARTGVYKYAGSEVDPENKHGLRDQASVNVLRDGATVFDRKAVHSFIGKPITNDHPHEAVTADNWKDHARGVVMGALKDGEHLSFDLLLTDASAIGDVDAGKRELSAGYAADLEFGDFTAADGTKCPVRQASIRGNHVAIVDRGRAGSECRIADAARCGSLPADVFELLTDSAKPYGDVEYADPGYQDDGQKRYPIDTEDHIRAAWNYIHQKKNRDQYTSDQLDKIEAKIIAAWKAKIDKAGPPSATTDGQTYNGISGGDKTAPARRETSNPSGPGNRLQDGDSQVAKTVLIDGYKFEVDDALETAVTKLQSQITALTTDKGKLETDVAKLTTDASTKDAEIVTLKKQVEDAKLSPQQLHELAAAHQATVEKAKSMGVTVSDTMDGPAIMKAVVSAKMGDAAKDWTDEQIAVSFATLTADVKVETTDALRETIRSQTVNVGDAKADYLKARDAARQELSTAWQRKPANAA